MLRDQPAELFIYELPWYKIRWDRSGQQFLLTQLILPKVGYTILTWDVLLVDKQCNTSQQTSTSENYNEYSEIPFPSEHLFGRLMLSQDLPSQKQMQMQTGKVPQTFTPSGLVAFSKASQISGIHLLFWSLVRQRRIYPIMRTE